MVINTIPASTANPGGFCHSTYEILGQFCARLKLLLGWQELGFGRNIPADVDADDEDYSGYSEDSNEPFDQGIGVWLMRRYISR